jgi:uncharacterized protein GlcG (DUF336 family)
MKTSISIPALSFEMSQALVSAAVTQAEQLGLKVCAAAIDNTGRLKAYLSMDGAPLIAERMVQQKAQTALLGLSSAQLGDAMQGAPAQMLSMGLQPGVNYLAGGVPVFSGDQVIGALAVGGATPEQDEACARAALEQFDLNV